MEDGDISDFSTDEKTTFTGRELLGASARLERLAWISGQVDPEGAYMLQGGAMARVIFQNAVECFVDGQFLAAIALGFSFVERSIEGRWIHTGGRTGLSAWQLLNEALRLGWLDDGEHTKLNNLRDARNAALHFRDQGANDTKVRKITAFDIDSNFEDHARKVMVAAIKILNTTAV